MNRRHFQKFKQKVFIPLAPPTGRDYRRGAVYKFSIYIEKLTYKGNIRKMLKRPVVHIGDLRIPSYGYSTHFS
jgi:hypothetical protein